MRPRRRKEHKVKLRFLIFSKKKNLRVLCVLVVKKKSGKAFKTLLPVKIVDD